MIKRVKIREDRMRESKKSEWQRSRVSVAITDLYFSGK